MSRFKIFNANISTQETNNVKFKAFYSIPVSPIKVIITTGSKPILNHFERAVLSLFVSGICESSEISEMLMLDIDLVELILSELKQKKLIEKTKEEILKILKENYKTTITNTYYVFYDYNRGVLLPQKCKSSDIVIYESKNNTIEINNLAFRDVKTYTPINIESQMDNLKIENIKRMLAKDIAKDENNTFIDAEIIEIDKKHYDLVGYVEAILDENNISRWQVINPISLKYDGALQQFFFDQNNNSGINNILKSLMELRKGQKSADGDLKLYEMIKNDLFNKEIKPAHEMFIDPLIRVMKSLSLDKFNGTTDVLYSKMDASKNAIINLTDIFEKVLYQAALENAHSNDLSYISNDSEINRQLLATLAKQKGYEINDSSDKLLAVTKRNLNKAINNPSIAKISECIAWNLIVAKNDENYFFNKIPFAISHSGENSKFNYEGKSFINMMYVFKRTKRDESRHSTKVSMATPREYVNLLFEIMYFAFGYQLNRKTYAEFMKNNSFAMDYSYAYEYLRHRIGAKMFDSNNERITALKISLLSMYNNFIVESSDYLAKARAIVEDLSKYMLNSFNLSLNTKDIYLSLEYFDSAEKYVDYINKLSFNTNTHHLIGNNIIDALKVDMYSKDNLAKGFNDEFKNSNLRVKLQGIIVSSHSNPLIERKLSENIELLKNIFVTITEIMYLDRAHQQNHEFDYGSANIICEDVIELVNNVLTIDNIINWEK